MKIQDKIWKRMTKIISKDVAKSHKREPTQETIRQVSDPSNHTFISRTQMIINFHKQTNPSSKGFYLKVQRIVKLTRDEIPRCLVISENNAQHHQIQYSIVFFFIHFLAAFKHSYLNKLERLMLRNRETRGKHTQF